MSVVADAKRKIIPYCEKLESVRLLNQKKVLDAFHQARVGTHCFTDSTGYGYHDEGRECLERVFATVFKTPAALVRPQIVSGTHAITLCLSLLGVGEELVSISGAPYDTLQQVIGSKGASKRSLINRGIHYQEVALKEDGHLDMVEIANTVTTKTRMVLLQRSRGYSWRPAISIADIKTAFAVVHEKNPNCICFVDNCYGEFVELLEPTEVGAQLVAGSLIKNPGGTLAPSGGYIVGQMDLVHECAEALTAPGIGAKVGPTFGLIRPLLQGFFMAPHIVGQAIMGAILVSQVFSDLGYQVSPLPHELRTDIIQAIRLEQEQKLLAFCRGIQKASPIDAQFMPVPDSMPGYEDPIVMAGGTFIQGSSLELSADAPVREPYIVYMQGGSSLEQVEIAMESVITELGLDNTSQ